MSTITQRAREKQYEAAAAFMRRLPGPQLVVPGNHDIPLYDVIRRFFFPLHALREKLNIPELNGDVDTIGGWIIQQLGRWPRQGDSVALGDYSVRVVAVQQKRVAQVLITPNTQEAARVDGPGKA